MADDIVSSIAALSESIREKVDELKHMHAESDSDDVQSLIERGHRLQKKSKKKKAPKSKDLSIQINCFHMEEKAKHSFVRVSPVYEVNVLKSDSYSEVLSKICVVLDLEETDECRLLTAGGSVISNDNIVVNSKEFSWNIGSYLTKKHISPGRLKLGVGYLKSSDDRVCPPKKRKKVSKEITLIKANKDDMFEVYYSERGSVVPYTRKEIWAKINGKEDCFDRYGVFWPEDDEFVVSRITRISKDASRMDLLKGSAQVFSQSTYPDECYTSFNCPIFNSPRKPVPLIVISSAHPNCRYEWICIEKRDYFYHNSPVVYVNEPYLFKCSVKAEGEKVCEVTFDVSYVPLEDIAPARATCTDISEHNSSDEGSRAVIVQIPTPTFHCLEFSTKEVSDATNDFDKRNEIGKGGFGNVFRAFNLRCDGTDAAVKVLSKEGCKALSGGTESIQMKVELQALMKFRHPNILPVMGYCFDENIRAIIYEFMRNGSLHDWIHNWSVNSVQPLSWDMRYSIIKDIFRGVAFLHEAKPPLIHQDIKSLVETIMIITCIVCSPNILLDENFVAKVGDFGFALELPNCVSGRTMVTAPLLARTEGYYPPEIMSGKLSPLCDVYSCGVVTLEGYTGLKAFCSKRCDSDLATFTEDDRSSIEKFCSIADEHATSDIDVTMAEVFLTISNKCLQRHSKRPTAKEVLAIIT